MKIWLNLGIRTVETSKYRKSELNRDYCLRLVMPRYTGLITKCLARGAGKLAVFQHAATDKFPVNLQGRGAEFQWTDA